MFRFFGLVKLQEQTIKVKSYTELLNILDNPPIITTQTQKYLV